MAKRITFPLTIKAGATAIRIYKNPMRLKHESVEKVYGSFVVSYYRGGRRERKRLKSLKLARDEAERIKTLVLNEDLVALQLTGHDRIVYSQVSEQASRLNRPLDLIVKEYVEAQELLESVSVLEAAHFYVRYGKTITAKKSVPEVVAEMIAGLRSDKLSDYHINATEQRLKSFADTFQGLITTVRMKQITEWLRELKYKEEGKEHLAIAPKTRNHYRNAVVQLFNFARDLGYLPKGLPTEAEAVKTVTVVPSENEIFTVEEMTTLLTNAKDHLIAPMAIKAFSGIRTEEMVRIKWEHVNWTNKHIVLPADVTKTSQRRIIPMPDNLFAWIERFKGQTGRISGRWKRAQALFQAFDRFGKRQKVEVGANKFRNSYISYRVAVTQDVQRVALESGNSPRVIQREYLELATEEDGKKWFGIYPTGQT